MLGNVALPQRDGRRVEGVDAKSQHHHQKAARRKAGTETKGHQTRHHHHEARHHQALGTQQGIELAGKHGGNSPRQSQQADHQGGLLLGLAEEADYEQGCKGTQGVEHHRANGKGAQHQGESSPPVMSAAGSHGRRVSQAEGSQPLVERQQQKRVGSAQHQKHQGSSQAEKGKGGRGYHGTHAKAHLASHAEDGHAPGLGAAGHQVGKAPAFRMKHGNAHAAQTGRKGNQLVAWQHAHPRHTGAGQEHPRGHDPGPRPAIPQPAEQRLDDGAGNVGHEHQQGDLGIGVAVGGNEERQGGRKTTLAHVHGNVSAHE